MATTADDFRRAQQGSAAHDVYALFMACRRRFLNAASLLEVDGAEFEMLQELGYQTVDLQPLMSMHSAICERYIEAFRSPQGSLFDSLEDEPELKWGHYFHHVLLPHLLLEDGVVRNVLRAMMAIPCRHPRRASEALVQHVSEMTLPKTRPRWEPGTKVAL